MLRPPQTQTTPGSKVGRPQHKIEHHKNSKFRLFICHLQNNQIMKDKKQHTISEKRTEDKSGLEMPTTKDKWGGVGAIINMVIFVYFAR